MPRPYRYELAGIPQHVVTRGNNRQRCFFADSDCRLYLECLRDAAARYACLVHAYVLMPNHVHLLLTPEVPGAIGKVLQSVGTRYVRCINDAHGRSGTLWEGRYKASLVDSVRYLLTCYRYIELNPVRAGIVDDPRDYPWSSHLRNAWGQPDAFVVEHPEFVRLAADPAGRRQAYRALFGDQLQPATVDDIRASLNQCRALGSAAFEADVERALQRRLPAARRGRPRNASEKLSAASETILSSETSDPV